MANEGLKVPIMVKATGQIIYVSPGIKSAKLKHYPNDYADAQEVKEEIPAPKKEAPKENPPEVEPSADEDSTEGMNLTQLREHAKGLGMRNTARKNKEQIMEFLNNL